MSSDRAPAAMPEDLRLATPESLMASIQGMCDQSCLTSVQIIGCLEGVKHAMLRNWFADDEGPPTEGADA